MPKKSHVQIEQTQTNTSKKSARAKGLTKKQKRAIDELSKELLRIDRIEQEAAALGTLGESPMTGQGNTTPNLQEQQAAELSRMERAEEKKSKGLHERVSMHSVPHLHSDYQMAHELEEAYAITAGVALVLGIVEQGNIDRLFIENADEPEQEPAPLLSANDEAVLLRFARVSASRFADESLTKLHRLSERARGGAHG